MAAHRVSFFDTWRPGYAGAVVTVVSNATGAALTLYNELALSTTASNPQTLTSRTDAQGVQYGKWNKSGSFYVSESYYLEINSTDQTGVIRIPMFGLDGEDGSDIEVTVTGGSVEHTLADILSRIVHVDDFGEFKAVGEVGQSSATNNATLTAAIGAAAGAGGGIVIVPPGSYNFTQLTIPSGVILQGQGRQATTLISITADKVITINGDRAGLRMITIDGSVLNAGSIGVFSKANDETVFDNVEVKRFETGIYFKGGRRAQWNNLYLENCATGAKLHGDDDAGGGADGDLFTNNRWDGGKVSNCTTAGVKLEYIDEIVSHNTICDVGFQSNTGIGLHILGARYTNLEDCWWSANTTAFKIEDDSPEDNENTVIGVHFFRGKIAGGAATIEDSAIDVIFEKIEFSDIDITLTTPENNILALDCTEDSQVTLAGVSTRWIRRTSQYDGASVGVTTDATVTKAWSLALEPGQLVRLNANVVARKRNAVEVASYGLEATAYRPGSTLAYDTQTGNFTAGLIVTGATSGATARIQADSDSGTTGTLTLIDISGVFIDNEIITDTSTGSATVNGILSPQNAALKGAVAAIGTTYEDTAGWNATIAVNGTEVEVQVTGAASSTVEWTVAVNVTSN